MRIALIGPVYPFKGGISHYTGMMYRALTKKHDVFMVSYSMQYPRLLFKKEQKDLSNDSFKVENTNYWLNTANLFNIAATARKIKKLLPELVIIQWWHPYFSPCYRILRFFLKGIPVMYVCHNVFPHERFPMDKSLTRSVLKKGDAFIVQSAGDAEDLLSVKPGALYKETPHPTYNAFKIADISKKEARALIGAGEEEKLILFFGFVREYKGLRYLIAAMPEIKKRTANAHLMIVGDFGDAEAEYREMIEKSGAADSITTVGGYIPDNEVEKYFAACDIVALPYTSATQSGIVQIAFGFEKPVIVTAVGGLPEVVEDGETGYIVPPMDSAAIADVATRHFDSGADFSAAIAKAADRFSWDRMTEAVDSLYAGISGGEVEGSNADVPLGV